MRLVNFVAAVAAAAAFVSAVSLPASAECKRYGFSVNDYGKDGPTNDAKGLLDKLIASKMSEKGVKDFHTGKKSVSCELFLNFIVFDEHTCTAEATVCWGGTPLPNSEQTAATEADAKVKATKTSSSEPAEKVTKNKKKELAKKSEAPVAEKKAVAVRIPDPKSGMQHKSEAKAEATQPSESEQPAAAAAAAQPDASETEASQSASENAPSSDAAVASQKTDTPPSTETAAANKHDASAKKPVETGSLGEPAKKHVKHAAKKTDSGAGEAASAKPATDGGYPTPEPPQEAPSP